MPTDPTLLLKADHRHVERLMQDIEQAEPAERAPLVDELATALAAHMQLEEDVLYPVIAEALGEKEAKSADSEHELAKVGLSKVIELSPDGPGFVAALDMLRAGITHHVQEEESSIFPELDEKLGEDRRTNLDQAMDRRRTELGLLTHDDMPDASRGELYEKAQRADVPGRSTMTREELAQAIPPDER